MIDVTIVCLAVIAWKVFLIVKMYKDKEK